MINFREDVLQKFYKQADFRYFLSDKCYAKIIFFMLIFSTWYTEHTSVDFSTFICLLA